MNQTLSKAEKALDRGEYGKCINFLEPLAEKHPASDKQGSALRMLLVTAYMGLGDDRKALKICRLLAKSLDKEVRYRAKKLIPILEAPTLKRPEEWSIQIPIKKVYTKDSSLQVYSRRKKIEKIIHPPTGETKGLGTGFFILVLIILTILALLLST